jgi:uncharacterized protein DUF6174
MHESARIGWTMVGAAALAVTSGRGNGDAGPQVAESVPSTTPSPASTVPPSTSPPPPTPSSTTPGEREPGPLEGVVVVIGQTMVEPYPWWWVIDLSGEATVEGSSRVLVEVPQDEVGCGEQFYPMFGDRIGEGEAVSFELVAGEPGPRPEFWMAETTETFESEPAVIGRRFRVPCPDGTEAAAEELAAQRAIWEQRGPDSYEFSMTWHIFNATYGDYRVGVADGAAVSIVKDATTRLAPGQVAGDLPVTIDELFVELERHLSGDSFVATYDSELGYPLSVEVDEMLEAVDDELEVRVSNLVAGQPAPVVDRPPAIGQRIEAMPVDWSAESQDGAAFWLLIDAAGGVTVDGSSRWAVEIPVGEVRCGADLRPIDDLEILSEGPASISFVVASLGAGPPPNETPMWRSGPSLSGRQLHLPVCPATTEDRLAELAAARARWEAAGIDDYEMNVFWGPLQLPDRMRITVVDGTTTSVVLLDESGEPGAPVEDPGVLDALPGTVEEIFDWLAAELAVSELEVIYDDADGHPHGAFGETTIDIELRPTGG